MLWRPRCLFFVYLSISTVDSHGNLTNEGDRKLIGSLEADAERSMPTLEVGYTGERNARGQMHGRGTNKWADGGVYEGEWKDGKQHGRGTHRYASGSAYEGEYKDGKRHGRGTFKYANGGVYEGEWKDGKMHGRGTENFSNGDGYEGEYKDGKRHGLGTHKLADGSVDHDGEWKDDKPLRG